jgi:hypothetical protein
VGFGIGVAGWIWQPGNATAAEASAGRSSASVGLASAAFRQDVDYFFFCAFMMTW